MTAQIPEDELSNYEHFRDELSAILIQRLTQTTTKPGRARSKKRYPEVVGHALSSDAEDLSDFIEFIANETFVSLPPALRTLDHHIWATTPSLQETYSLPLTAESTSPLLVTFDPVVSDSLLAYGVINSTDDKTLPADSSRPIALADLFAPILTSYIEKVTAKPPPPSSTKSQVTACEICQRDWINLSYHHLIPRFVHAKVVKRGWHRPDELQNVAWLCGACHAFVHCFAGHEDLARYYYTVDLLLAQPEIVAWAEWVGRLRWKGLGGGPRRKAR
ncbi:hypothetical protein QBC47DRAFT_378704 [Echria macrotheca]|uniref:HNH domain-containing protein n=1 Tax=Echria macrotheca TaxID=438768 RepID=A0AAJ0F7U4_9PEZI|nr:hypothetical protein QBC47DRAFT_378704 [Echria macrotheca]